jgi:hypothetical protein
MTVVLRGECPRADQERLGDAVLVLDSGAVASAWQVGAAEPLGATTPSTPRSRVAAAPAPSRRRSGSAFASAPHRLAPGRGATRAAARTAARASSRHRGEADRTLGTSPAPGRHAGAPCRPGHAAASGGCGSRDCHQVLDRRAPRRATPGGGRGRSGWTRARGTPRCIPAGPRAQAHGASVAAQLETHPVELHLDGPTVAERHRRRARQHGGDEAGKLLDSRETHRQSK